jgi:adenylosuccinate synthase
MKQGTIIIDLQYGSCGKGLIAGYIAKTRKPDTIVTAWSPNSGHTYIDEDGNVFINTALPNGIVSPNLRTILLGPGSVINPDALWDELNRYDHLVRDVGVFIHEGAAVVNDEHRHKEHTYGFAIGSTMKGVGEAVIEKIQRRPSSNIIARDALVNTPLEGYVVSADQYNDLLDRAQNVLIEGSQGFSLSINQGFYPFTTSRDCTVHQVLSDCGIPHRFFDDLHVIGAARTFPIRVANRFNEAGEQVGYSGPCYTDQIEIDWSRLGMEPELTTVTKLPRRVFTWSAQQIADAIRMNGVDSVFLNFVNYIDRDLAPDAMTFADYIDSIHGAGAKVGHLGFGPNHNDVDEM